MKVASDSDSGGEDGGVQMGRRRRVETLSSGEEVDLSEVNVRAGDMEEVDACVSGPLIVNFSGEEREEAIEMMRDYYEYWKGRDSRRKSE